MRSLVLPAFLSALALPAIASAQSTGATPDKAEPSFSLSIERVVSANAIFVRIDDEKARSKGITAGGPISNPLAAPRVAFDYLGKSGLTLGVGLAFAVGDLDAKDHEDDWNDEGGYNLVMLAPRVGYRLQVADWLDLTPRAGVTFGYASIQSGEYEYCDYDYDTGEDLGCETTEGEKLKAFAAVANLELAGTFRITDSFNVITAVSYDMLLAAKGKSESSDPYDDGDDSDSAKFKDGHLSSLQLWLGVGGYF